MEITAIKQQLSLFKVLACYGLRDYGAEAAVQETDTPFGKYMDTL